MKRNRLLSLIAAPVVLLALMAFALAPDEKEDAQEILKKAKSYFLKWSTSKECGDLEVSLMLFYSYEVLAKRNNLASEGELIDVVDKYLRLNNCLTKRSGGGGVDIKRDNYKMRLMGGGTSGSGGGGVTVGREIPATYFATFFMNETERAKFLEALDESTRADYTEWLINNSQLTNQIKTNVETELAPLRIDANRLDLERAINNQQLNLNQQAIERMARDMEVAPR